MIGRTPATISATRPLRQGVIADFEVTEEMLRYFIRKAQERRFTHPRVVMCVPSGVTEVEKRAVEEACQSAGARQVQLIEECIAAAIGAGLPIAEPRGHLVVDIGGGTSEVALISLGGIVVSESLRVGGYDLDEAIAAHVRRQYRLAIGQQTAEDVKLAVGSAVPLREELETEIRGRDVVAGLPKSVTLTSQEVRAAPGGAAAVDRGRGEAAARADSSRTGLRHRGAGMQLAGGGSLLRGFDERLWRETGMSAYLVDSPLDRRRGGRRAVAGGVRAPGEGEQPPAPLPFPLGAPQPQRRASALSLKL